MKISYVDVQNYRKLKSCRMVIISKLTGAKIAFFRTLRANILKENIKKVVKPSHRRELAQKAVQEKSIPVRLACAMFSISETCYRYQPRLADENAN